MVEDWGRSNCISAIARLVGSNGDRSGTHYFQSVKITISIAIELSYHCGIKLGPVESKIVDLSVEVVGSIGSDFQVVVIVSVNGSGSRT